MSENNLIQIFEDGLKNGYAHFKVSDGTLLTNVSEILLALQKEGEITVIKPDSVKQYALTNDGSEYKPILKKVFDGRNEEVIHNLLDSDIAVQSRPMDGREIRN